MTQNFHSKDPMDISELMLEIYGRDQEKYQKLKEYLEKETKEGKTEFRIAFQDDSHFIIHPIGKDGTTLDMWLYGQDKNKQK